MWSYTDEVLGKNCWYRELAATEEDGFLQCIDRNGLLKGAVNMTNGPLGNPCVLTCRLCCELALRSLLSANDASLMTEIERDGAGSPSRILLLATFATALTIIVVYHS